MAPGHNVSRTVDLTVTDEQDERSWFEWWAVETTLAQREEQS